MRCKVCNKNPQLDKEYKDTFAAICDECQYAITDALIEFQTDVEEKVLDKRSEHLYNKVINLSLEES